MIVFLRTNCSLFMGTYNIIDNRHLWPALMCDVNYDNSQFDGIFLWELKSADDNNPTMTWENCNAFTYKNRGKARILVGGCLQDTPKCDPIVSIVCTHIVVFAHVSHLYLYDTAANTVISVPCIFSNAAQLPYACWIQHRK